MGDQTAILPLDPETITGSRLGIEVAIIEEKLGSVRDGMGDPKPGTQRPGAFGGNRFGICLQISSCTAGQIRIVGIKQVQD